MADVFARVGDVAPNRIPMRPAPGTATEADVLRIATETGRLYELVDGILVEKIMGLKESGIAVVIASLLLAFVRPRKLGLVAGADGMMRLWPGLVHIPDVSFLSVSKGRSSRKRS